MKNKNKETKNVHGDAEVNYDTVLQAKAKELVELMNKEPRAQLVPTLRVTEQGIIPDARLVLLPNKEEEDGTTKQGEAEGDSDCDGEEGCNTATDAEPTES